MKPSLLAAAFCGSLTLISCSGASPQNEQQHRQSAGLKVRDEQPPHEEPGPPDGPFGIAEGEPLSRLSSPMKQEVPGLYKLATTPEPYPGIEFYLVQNTPQHGTCMVKAISTDIASDSQGSELMSAVDHVEEDLVERYGKPQKFDFLHSGSIWNQPEDWLMGLSKSERSYSYFWERPKGADPKVWRGVTVIGLVAGADGSKGWYTIEYDFENIKECEADLKHEAAKNL
jgi:hypothetical protein